MPKVNNGEPPHPNKSCKKQTKQGFFLKKVWFYTSWTCISYITFVFCFLSEQNFKLNETPDPHADSWGSKSLLRKFKIFYLIEV